MFWFLRFWVPPKRLPRRQQYSSRIAQTGLPVFISCFDQHEIVLSNNMEPESFHPGQVGLADFEKEIRAGILEVFSELRVSQVSYGETARLCLNKSEAKVICAMVPYLAPMDVRMSGAA
ncbi:MAG: Hint domain-containing protein [Marinosulfonomonas sp.]|nr:Hint domain-containing protein [Marinosulfonomonas sp.]